LGNLKQGRRVLQKEKENLRYTLTHLLKKDGRKKHSIRKRKKPAAKGLIKFQKKNKIPELDSSSEDEIGFDETTPCDDSSD